MTITTISRIILLLAPATFSLLSQAQTTQQSNTDAGPLPSTEGGNPASSYALSGIEHVNYFNGDLNVTIPLLKVAGRGAAGYKIFLPIEQRWSVWSTNASGYLTVLPMDGLSSPSGGISSYFPGRLSILKESAHPNGCYDSSLRVWFDEGPFLTRVIWTAADGTQTALVDSVYDGQPRADGCPASAADIRPANRGKRFRSMDGSGMIFAADQDLQDWNGPPSVTGTLWFRDGTKYQIDDDGLVQQIEDRNGNLTRLDYSFDHAVGHWNPFTITDPLNRVTTIQVSPSQDTITCPGANGDSHTITINRGELQYVLDSGYSSQTYSCLFPELDGSSETSYNPTVVQSVGLPDGTSYQFRYNSYGEVTRLQLPTGAVYRYTYPAAQACSPNSGSGVIGVTGYVTSSIYRRVIERDELSDGTNVSAKTIFPTPSYGNADPNHRTRGTTTAEVDFEDPSGATLRKEIHYFYGNPSAMDSVPERPTDYPKWTDGLEFRTDIGGTGGALRSLQNVHTQRPCGSLDANCWFDVQADASPAHDPQLCQSNTTLDGAMTSAVVSSYDQYNNPTDTWEFHYGAGPGIGASCPGTPGGFARHTQTSYVTWSPYPDKNLVNLPDTRTVMDSSGAVVAKTHYGYDEYGQGSAAALTGPYGIVGHDDTNYGLGFIARGNLTNPANCLDIAHNCPPPEWINHVRDYDIFGNIVRQYDGDNNPTDLRYNDDLANEYAFPTTITNALGQATSYRYDYSIGKPILATDPNNVTTRYGYATQLGGTIDGLDRLTQVRRAADTGVESQMNTRYMSPTSTQTFQDQNTAPDYRTQTQQYYDGLGRAIESRTFEDDVLFTAVDTTYDALGRMRSVSNPYRPGDAINWTTTSYDALGRVTQVTMPGGASSTTSYAGNQTTITDPAGKKRTLTYDGLGRLTQVWKIRAG